MKTIFLKPTLNPAFKITQPLPLLPADFVVRHARAARRFTGQDWPAETVGPRLASTYRGVVAISNELHSRSARLVA